MARPKSYLFSMDSCYYITDFDVCQFTSEIDSLKQGAAERWRAPYGQPRDRHNMIYVRDMQLLAYSEFGRCGAIWIWRAAWGSI